MPALDIINQVFAALTSGISQVFELIRSFLFGLAPGIAEFILLGISIYLAFLLNRYTQISKRWVAITIFTILIYLILRLA